MCSYDHRENKKNCWYYWGRFVLAFIAVTIVALGIAAAIGYGIYSYELEHYECNVKAFEINSSKYYQTLDYKEGKSCLTGLKENQPPRESCRLLLFDEDPLRRTAECCGQPTEETAGNCCNRHTRIYQPLGIITYPRDVKYTFSLERSLSEVTKNFTLSCDERKRQDDDQRRCFHILEQLEEKNVETTKCNSAKEFPDHWYVFNDDDSGLLNNQIFIGVFATIGLLGTVAFVCYLFEGWERFIRHVQKEHQKIQQQQQQQPTEVEMT